MKFTKWHISPTKIKEKVNPYDFYLHEQNLQRFGYKSGQWAVAGLCPFHADSKADSFKINTETGSFRCFSCGEKGGDIISFVQKKYNLPFKQALEKLEQEWRVS